MAFVVDGDKQPPGNREKKKKKKLCHKINNTKVK